MTTHIISLGAGVQSTVMLLMAESGEIQPRPKAAIFADTGWEPQAIYAHLAWLETRTSIPIHRAGNGRNLLDDTMRGVDQNGRTHSHSIPCFVSDEPPQPPPWGIGRRECTSNYKIIPIQREVRRIIGRPDKSRARTPRAIQWIGISRDETHRMRDSRLGYIENRYPLVELRMSRHDCRAWFAERYPSQPLAKSACIGSPYHGPAQWLELARGAATPEEMEQAYLLDDVLHSGEWPGAPGRRASLHRSGEPLRDLVARWQRQREIEPEMDLFGEECEGICGV